MTAHYGFYAHGMQDKFDALHFTKQHYKLLNRMFKTQDHAAAYMAAQPDEVRKHLVVVEIVPVNWSVS